MFIRYNGLDKLPSKVKELLPYIISTTERSKARYEVHSFTSTVMIDIWIAHEFHVIQIYGDEVGMSLITEDNPGFDTRPDITFEDIGAFKTEFEKIFP